MLENHENNGGFKQFNLKFYEEDKYIGPTSDQIWLPISW